MRKAFNDELIKAARRDDRINMVLADIGYGEIETFASEFPERFINCGVAEQNMTGVACGIALEGGIAITYSIANFPTLRCLEQVRNDVCYHNANVKIVIIGGGLAYGPLGISHHSTEDLAIMRALPNICVLAPCDCQEARAAVHAMLAHQGPVYYRCGYKGEKDIHEEPIEFKIGKALKIGSGSDLTILFAGAIGYSCKLARELLRKDGIQTTLLSMHTVKPIDIDSIREAATNTGGLLVVEEHNRYGGLGGAVAEALMELGLGGIKFRHLALPDVNVSLIGSQPWLLEQYKLSPAHIASAAREMLHESSKRIECTRK